MFNWFDYVKTNEASFRSPEFQDKFPAVTDKMIYQWLAEKDEPTDYKQNWYRTFISSK